MKKIFIGSLLMMLGCLQYAYADCEEIFTDYWMRQYWGKISVSGGGSDLIQTATIQKAIPELLREYGCEIMADAPCGDFYWMRAVDLPVKKYIGIDVVKAMINDNQNKFGNKQRSFLALDLTNEIIPKSDLVLCRDCLVHLSYAEIAIVIQNFKESGSQYLLTTTFPERSPNQDISTGGWRPLNFLIAPFYFPQPLTIINENCTERDGYWYDKSLALWKIEELPDLSHLIH